MRTVRTAHDDDGVDEDGQRHDVADKSVRRRVNDDVIVIRTRPVEEVGDRRRAEDRRRRHPIGRKRGDDVKMRLGEVIHQLGEIRMVRTGILQDMREAVLLVDVHTPDLRKPRTPQVEVNVQNLASRLGVGNGERRRGNRLAFARLRRNDQDAVAQRLVSGRVQQVAKASYGFGEHRMLVRDERLRDILALLAAHVREDRQHLERKTVFNVRKVDDRILQVVEDEHEENTQRDGHEESRTEDEGGIRQDGLFRNRGLTADADNFVVGLCREARLVFVRHQALQQLVGDRRLLFESLQPGLRQHNALSDGRLFASQVFLLLPQA